MQEPFTVSELSDLRTLLSGDKARAKQVISALNEDAKALRKEIEEEMLARYELVSYTDLPLATRCGSLRDQGRDAHKLQVRIHMECLDGLSRRAIDGVCGPPYCAASRLTRS